jgi:predicted AlkP superfamily phosphohydrolase/phosphomutase
LVIGLDGVDLGIVEALGPARLPQLHEVMGRGAFAALRSVQPPATLPNWTTFLTGLDPGRHGVFDFTTRQGYRVRFTGGTAREAPTLFQRLDALGLKCACLSFPGTWPPEKLEHGIFVSGWDAPVAFEADRSFMWPPSLYDETVAKFGTPTFDDVDEFHADEPGWIDALPNALARRVERKTRWAQWLLEREDWDVFALYFGESDTAAHYLWAHHDPESPRRPEQLSATQREGLAIVYQALDRAVAQLRKACGANAEITILSDHGSGGSSDKVVHINRLLADHDLLQFTPRRPNLGAGLKEVALRRFPPRLRERLFRLGNAWLPSRLESNVRFGKIDMPRTIAFSDELNYFPGVHLNLRGREPSGTVDPQEKQEAILRVRAALLSVRDPWNGRPVFADVIRREELFDGPYLERAPDLLLELHLDDGYSYNVMPSGPASESFRRLAPEEYLGKKGRSLPGSHRARGFMAMAGPSVLSAAKIDAQIADVSATMLHRMGLCVPTDFQGRVLWEAVRPETGRAETSLPASAALPARPRSNEGIVESRLRALGYIE